MPAKGYIQVVLGNVAATPVWFDDLQATAVQQQRQPATPPISSSERSKPAEATSIASLTEEPPTSNLMDGTCTRYTDTYYNIYTGEILWTEVYDVCGGGGPSGGGGGDGSGGTGGGGGGPSGGGGDGNGPSATIIPRECAGLQQALLTQSQTKREVAGYIANDGSTILFSTGDDTDSTATLSFPMYGSDHHLISNGPYKDDKDGLWKIEINDWTGGNYTLHPYVLAYAFHTHPIGKAPNGRRYDSDNPSPEDTANANNYPGLERRIVNANKEIIYDSTHVISTQANHCK